jgi:hypothetical protein
MLFNVAVGLFPEGDINGLLGAVVPQPEYLLMLVAQQPPPVAGAAAPPPPVPFAPPAPPGPVPLLANAQAQYTNASKLYHPQPATSIICDNTCAVGIVNDTCKIKRLKAIDMRFHWVRDRVRQGHFTVTWQPGNRNLADFFTKPLAVYLHKQLKQLYIHSPAVLRKSS